MKKNTSGQTIGAELVSASDGSAFTGAVTVYVTGDGGTQAAGSVGSGACTHEGNGFHTYAPAQAETNYDHVAFTFTGTGAIPVTVQVYPGFPQTGDNYARLGAPAGASLAADVAAIQAVVDLFTTAHAEPTGVPAANETPLDKLAYVYMMLRNKITVTADTKTYFDDGGAAEFKKGLTDDGTTYTEAEAAAP